MNSYRCFAMKCSRAHRTILCFHYLFNNFHELWLHTLYSILDKMEKRSRNRYGRQSHRSSLSFRIEYPYFISIHGCIYLSCKKTCSLLGWTWYCVTFTKWEPIGRPPSWWNRPMVTSTVPGAVPFLSSAFTRVQNHKRLGGISFQR